MRNYKYKDRAESKKTKTFKGVTGHLAIFTRMKGF